MKAEPWQSLVGNGRPVEGIRGPIGDLGYMETYGGYIGVGFRVQGGFR